MTVLAPRARRLAFVSLAVLALAAPAWAATNVVDHPPLPDPRKFDPRSTTLQDCDFSGCPPAWKTTPQTPQTGAGEPVPPPDDYQGNPEQWNHGVQAPEQPQDGLRDPPDGLYGRPSGPGSPGDPANGPCSLCFGPYPGRCYAFDRAPPPLYGAPPGAYGGPDPWCLAARHRLFGSLAELQAAHARCDR
jgi:hypothetical protein